MENLPVLDPDQMKRLEEWGGMELQNKMIDLFLSHAEPRLDQVREGLADGNPQVAESGAHTLKSAAGNVGAQRVQRLAQEAENLAEEKDLDGLRELLPSLEKEFQTACKALGELRGK